MNSSGEVADLMVKEGIQITESSVKLMALGAKNLAAIIIALNEDKLQGKTSLKKMLKAEKPLCIMQIKENDLKAFNTESKKYGVLFTAVSDKTNNTGICDIMEKLGYAAPIENTPDKENTEVAQDKSQSKNSAPRVKENPSGGRYTKRGDTERMGNNSKPSVKNQINNIKAQRAKKQAGRNPVRQHTRTAPKIKKER